MKIARAVFALSFVLTSSASAQDSQIGETERSPAGPSAGFDQSQADAVKFLQKNGLGDHFETPSFGSMSQNDFEKRVAAIKAETPMVGVSSGTKGAMYDVILQSGHYGRVRGAVGTSGQLVTERALNAYISNKIAQRLRAEGLNVLLLSADDYARPTPGAQPFNGMKAKIFVAIHSDGSASPCSTGPSLAYSAPSSLFAMHAVGYALSSALGYRYDQFNRDNFTANEAHYYMFRQVVASRLTGLLEVGELTCLKSEKALIENADGVAINVAQALSFVSNTVAPK